VWGGQAACPPDCGCATKDGAATCNEGECCLSATCCAPLCCDDGCSACDSDAEKANRFYASAEYLLWAIKDSRLPVLATTGTGTSIGLLGEKGTVILFGGTEVDNEARSGGRFTAGWWLDDCQTTGIEGSFFILPQRSVNFQANSNEFPILGRPFFNAATGMQSAEFTAFPRVSRGAVNIDSPSRLWGASADLRENLCCGCWYRLDALVGFRFLDLDEALHVTENSVLLPTVFQVFPMSPFPPGTRSHVVDSFATRNDFYGGEVGLDAEFHRGRWSLDLKGKVALGEMHEVVDINGNQFVLQPGRPLQTFQGGLLALSSNSGHHVRDRFAVAPEAGATVGYQITDRLRLFAGYNFLFMSSVVRPGDQIDTVIDAHLVPNLAKFNPAVAPGPPVKPARPLFQFHETSFWAQGVTCGLEFRY
jgi:hypothetical protein